MFAALGQDIRFATRLLVKDRSFTITSLLTLAVCLGANTAMFGIVRSVLLKPLPFPESARIVLLYNSYPNAGAPRVGAAVPDYFDRQTAVPALDIQAVFRQEGATYGDENGSDRLTTLRATPSFFRLVHAQPIQGRVFTDDEGEPGKDAEVLLSYGLWQRKFAGRASIVGETIRLNGSPFDVVGVLPQDFTFLQNDIDAYVPASFTPEQKSDSQRHANGWQMVGRLRAGATVTEVQQQVNALNAANDARFPELHQILKDARFHTVAVLLQDDVVRDVKARLYLLWGGVLFVLLIGGINITNLVIVRAASRRREMATRHAIGADLGRLARQVLTETMLLAAAGGALGILLGWWALRWVAAINLDQMPRGYEVRLDWLAVVAVGTLSLVVGAVIGMAPMLGLRRMNLNAELREESRGGTSGRRANLVRRGLAVAQVAIALVLLVGAGLLLASFRAILHIDVGFDPTNVSTATVSPPATDYKDAPALVTFEQRALAAIRSLPDVEAVGATSLVPFSGDNSSNVIMAEGHVMKPGESLLAPMTATVTAGYFEAMHARILAGRTFDARDGADAPHTVIVDDRLARAFWPGEDALGRRLYLPSDSKDIQKITPQTRFFTVVGVIKEIHTLDPNPDVTPVGSVFFPHEQNPARNVTFMVRTRGTAPAVMAEVRRAIAGIDPQLPVYRARTMTAWIDRALVGRRVPMLIAAAFAAVAVFLAGVGIYGVLAYAVVQRRRELGVRMALGGAPSHVFRIVLRDGLRIAGIGLAAGLALAVGVGEVMKSQLFGVTPLNPLVIGGVAVILFAVAVLASVIPALRASAIDPIVVLSR